ncbi:isoprenylcysteine carboxylmethyltransferase family protein [Bdellovibrionota bacterium FG-1]
MATQEMTADSSGAYLWYRGFIQGKTRIALAWLFAIGLGFFARNYPQWPGIIVCFLGATIRFWASGYLRKDSRPAVGGPYAWVRNPLYLGTYLMALGTALAIEAWWLLGAASILFAAIYHYIILDEETKLRRIFGEPYEQYCRVVPRFFPRPWRVTQRTAMRESQKALTEVNPETAHHHYDWPLSMKNKAYEAFASFAGLIGFVAIAAWAWQRLG